MNVRLTNIRQSIKSPRGKSVMIFMAFLALSGVLWIVQSLTEEVQRDLPYKVVIDNVPDSLIRITPLPENINVSVTAKGIDLVKYSWSKEPEIKIDYQRYQSGNRVYLSESAIKTYVRNKVGGTCVVQSITPDSVSIAYTSFPGVKLPVKPDVKVSAAHQYVMKERVSLDCDSVTLYSLDGKHGMTSLTTMPLSLNDVSKDVNIKVPVMVPPNCRAIPDSVTVRVKVEPLVSKSRYVTITPINTPRGVKLIPVPSQVEVFYMMPMSAYKENASEPDFRIVADYRSINEETNKVALSSSNVSSMLINVFLDVDSVEYIIERVE